MSRLVSAKWIVLETPVFAPRVGVVEIRVEYALSVEKIFCVSSRFF